MKASAVCILFISVGVTIPFFSCKKSSLGSHSVNGTDSSNSVFASTIAGNTISSAFDFGPTGVATDLQGNVFASIDGDGYIVKISKAGVLSTFAGSKGNFGCEAGTGTSATFTNPYAICADAQGNIYVADFLCDGIKKITPDGVSTKLCSSDITNNIIIAPQAIAIDGQGNLYSADELGEDGITKTSPGGVVTRIAGAIYVNGYVDGPVASAEFEGPSGICVDGNGIIYLADAHRIRKIANGSVSTVAGNAAVGYADGKGSAATFGGAMGLCMGPDGNIYIADVYNNMIRRMTPDGTVSTVSGTGDAGFKDGNPLTAQFNQPSNLCFDSNGNLYVADYGNALVRKITFPK
jgi:sugar lactone lactonase YvrE